MLMTRMTVIAAWEQPKAKTDNLQTTKDSSSCFSIVKSKLVFQKSNLSLELDTRYVWYTFNIDTLIKYFMWVIGKS